MQNGLTRFIQHSPPAPGLENVLGTVTINRAVSKQGIITTVQHVLLVRWRRAEMDEEAAGAGGGSRGKAPSPSSPWVLPWQPPAPQGQSWCKGRGDGPTQLGLLRDTTTVWPQLLNQILALSLKNPGLQWWEGAAGSSHGAKFIPGGCGQNLSNRKMM